jgi:tRNA(Ser,Leu) C12 N-acetylase TAN1
MVTVMEWNVVIAVNTQGFGRAFAILSEFGTVKKTDFYNVLVMEARDVSRMLEDLREKSAQDPDFLSFLSRLVPVAQTFGYQTLDDFRKHAADTVMQWIPTLGGRSFHVRMHRRGFKSSMASPEEERFLDHVILEALERVGTPARVTFEDPDFIVAVETVGQRAGMSLWSREELQRYPFVRLD